MGKWHGFGGGGREGMWASGMGFKVLDGSGGGGREGMWASGMGFKVLDGSGGGGWGMWASGMGLGRVFLKGKKRKDIHGLVCGSISFSPSCILWLCGW